MRAPGLIHYWMVPFSLMTSAFFGFTTHMVPLASFILPYTALQISTLRPRLGLSLQFGIVELPDVVNQCSIASVVSRAAWVASGCDRCDLSFSGDHVPSTGQHRPSRATAGDE
jgi:hypothetical protein